MNDIHKKLKAAYPDIEKTWDDNIIPTLCEYIKIPNKSPLFDQQWQQHGYMDKAMQLIVDWCHKHPLKNMQLDVVKTKDRTPLLLIDIPGQSDETVLLYGHMDKQPEMQGWDKDKDPWQPVMQAGKLYGRGAADDGYSVFAAMTAIATLQQNDIPHARCVILIEASEESGSIDLVHYIQQLKKQIGEPNFIICLDSGAGNYEQLWGTTSLRGLAAGELEIEVLKEGIHSGLGSGVVPSVFQVLRKILDRIEDSSNGKILLDALQVKIPQHRIDEAKATAKTLDNTFLTAYPFAGTTQACNDDITELLLNRTWRPALSITGIQGIPKLENAGNVTLPKIKLHCSIRLAPTSDPEAAQKSLKKAFEMDPPFGANVKYTIKEGAVGWHAPQLADWLAKANDEASQLFFNKPAAYFGEGGSIPFMGMLGEMFPKAQFLITGVLGPLSNAHGPNEFLHIDYVKKLTACVASVLAAHHLRLQHPMD